ncbi:MAG TPA: hypothetical protein VFM55_19145 [Micromonosporaceae bacterium]|nr:hypothetical protein [Micromonosporaceae bacterium]
MKSAVPVALGACGVVLSLTALAPGAYRPQPRPCPTPEPESTVTQIVEIPESEVLRVVAGRLAETRGGTP